jgi:hypothetical protein
MRLPIGIQDFTKLRENNYLYVDKTMYFSYRINLYRTNLITLV